MRRTISPALAVALVLLVSIAGGATPGMITRVVGEEVVINRGSDQGVMPGARWFVYRLGRPVAEVEVVLVDDFTSTARVVAAVEGRSPRVGDTVSQRPFDSSVAASKPSESPPAQARSIPAPVVTPRDVRKAERRYAEIREKRTRSRTFSGGTQHLGEGRGVDPLSLINIATAIGYGGRFESSIPLLVSTISEAVGTQVVNSELYQEAMVEVQVTYWDERLLDAYADLTAYREGRSSAEEQLAIRQGLAAQKGLDRYHVFQVKIKGGGPGTVQLAPFHWHIFLLDASGNRVKADRYDQVLDRTLNPDQEVEGYVYFRRSDLSGSGPITVLLEDMLGERAELRF